MRCMHEWYRRLLRALSFCITIQLSQSGCSSVKYMNVSRHKQLVSAVCGVSSVTCADQIGIAGVSKPSSVTCGTLQCIFLLFLIGREWLRMMTWLNHRWTITMIGLQLIRYVHMSISGLSLLSTIHVTLTLVLNLTGHYGVCLQHRQEHVLEPCCHTGRTS